MTCPSGHYQATSGSAAHRHPENPYEASAHTVQDRWMAKLSQQQVRRQQRRLPVTTTDKGPVKRRGSPCLQAERPS
jgi:hypothetical protein